MKWILSLLVCWSASAQLPVVPYVAPNSAFAFGSITNLYVELFVDSAADWTLTSGTHLTWLDRTAYHNDFTNFISPPSFSTSTGPNGYGAVHFLTASGGSGGTVTSVNTLSNQPNFVMCVAGVGGTATGQTLMDAFFGNRESWRLGTGGANLFYAGTAVTPNDFTTVSNWHIFTMVFNGANSYIRTNGVLWKSGNTGAGSLGHASFGQDLSLVTPFKGYFAAFLAAQEVPGTNELIAVERALNTKYNLGYTIPSP